jgi:hypothetical protein
MWTVTDVLILAVSNIICVCLGFYLGRITKDKASGPAMPRLFPEKPTNPEQDLYYEAMHGGEQQSIPTIEDIK